MELARSAFVISELHTAINTPLSDGISYDVPSDITDISQLQVAPSNASPNPAKLSKRAAVDESQLPTGWSYKGCYVYVGS